MAKQGMTRRGMLAGGVGAMGALGLARVASAAGTSSGLSPAKEQLIRRWYAGWMQKDWAPLDAMLAEDFTFSSAAGDDHISKSAFKRQCWQTQINFIAGFDIESLIGRGDEAFVKYTCRTTNGKSLRNIEYLRVSDDKIKSIECFFGEDSSFPSAVSQKKS